MKKLLFNLPMLPNNPISFIFNYYTTGKLKKFKLPISYLSYLKLLGRLVSSGKSQVGSQISMNTAFGKIGKVFRKKQFKQKIILSLIALPILSCKPSYQLTQQDRELLRKYPEIILLYSGKKHIVEARKLEITDSLRNAFQADLAAEYQEEMYQSQD